MYSTKPIKALIALLILLCISNLCTLFALRNGTRAHLIATGTAKGQLWPLTRLAVWRYINTIKLKHPHIVYKQAIMETSLRSRFAIHNKNILNLRLPNSRGTTAIGEHDGFAVYTHWTRCVDDYALLQAQYRGSTDDDYYDFLGTYGDSLYVPRLREAVVPIPVLK